MPLVALQVAKGCGAETANLQEMNAVVFPGLLLATLVVAVHAQAAPSLGTGPRPGPVVRRPADAPLSAAPERRRLELQFPRALEPLRGARGPARPGNALAPGRVPVAGRAVPSAGGHGQLRMPPGLTGGSQPDRLPAVAVPQPADQAPATGWAERWGRSIAGVALLALGLAGAWWAWRRRARSE